jgi:hypothetical protein
MRFKLLEDLWRILVVLSSIRIIIISRYSSCNIGHTATTVGLRTACTLLFSTYYPNTQGWSNQMRFLQWLPLSLSNCIAFQLSHVLPLSNGHVLHPTPIYLSLSQSTSCLILGKNNLILSIDIGEFSQDPMLCAIHYHFNHYMQTYFGRTVKTVQGSSITNQYITQSMITLIVHGFDLAGYAFSGPKRRSTCYLVWLTNKASPLMLSADQKEGQRII